MFECREQKLSENLNSQVKYRYMKTLQEQGFVVLYFPPLNKRNLRKASVNRCKAEIKCHQKSEKGD